MSLNPFKLFEYRYGVIAFIVLFVLALCFLLTVARIANRHLNPESAARDTRPIGPMERWLESVLVSRPGLLVTHCLIYAMFPILFLCYRPHLEAKFRALDSGEISEMKTHSLLALAYNGFGLTGAIVAVRIICGLLILIALTLISARISYFMKTRGGKIVSVTESFPL